MAKVKKEDLTRVRVEDVDEEILMQLAKEGRLYIEVDDKE